MGPSAARRRARGALTGAVGALVSAGARAEPATKATEGELRYDLKVDVPVIAVGSVGWVVSQLLESRLAPSACRWCDRDAAGNDRLNALDASVRTLRWKNTGRWTNTGAADTISSAIGFFVLPVGVLGLDAVVANHDDRADGFLVDALVIVEAAVVAQDLNQLTKFVVSRERPFVHALKPEEKGATPHPADNNVSFFSGHTTSSFSLAVAAGTVSSMRGYRWAPAVWATGLALATATGYLRIAADKHYFTDVMTGLVVGSGLGFSIPYLFHRPADANAPIASLRIAPLSQGRGAVVSGAF